MAKGSACPIKNDTAMLEVAGPIFEDMLDRYSKLDLTKVALYKSINTSLRKNNPELSRLFLKHLQKKNIPDSYLYVTENSNQGFADFIDEDVRFDEVYADDFATFEESIQGMDTKEGEQQEPANFLEDGTSKHLRDGGEQHFQDIVFGAIGERLTRKEYAVIVEDARSMSLNAFVDTLGTKYPELLAQEDTRDSNDRLVTAVFGNSIDNIKSPIVQRNIVSFHANKQKENSIKINPKAGKPGKIKLFRTNIYRDTEGELNITKGKYRWAQQPEENPITGRKNPEYEFASFIDNSKVKLGLSNQELGKKTYSIDSKHIVKYVPSQKSGKFYPRNIASKITRAELNNWLIELATLNNTSPLTVVSAKPGDSASFYVSPIFKEYYDAILPRDMVEVLIEKSDLPDKTKQFFRDKNFDAKASIDSMNNLYKQAIFETKTPQAVGDYGVLKNNEPLDISFQTMKEAEDYVKAQNIPKKEEPSKSGKSVKLVPEFSLSPHKLGAKDKGKIRESQRQALSPVAERIKKVSEDLKKLAVVGFNNYVKQEKDNGYINEKNAQDLRNSIKSSHIPRSINDKGVVRETMPMSTWAASLIARHEWTKAARHNHYALEDDIFNLLNRMRLPMSQGTTLSNLNNVKVRHIDPDKVYYTYEGNRVTHQETIKGIAGKTNINDGASFVDTDLLEDSSNEIGRYPVKKSEVSAKQMKTSYYKRSEDGDSYIEIKHEEFVAIPGMKVFDKNTGDLIASMEKEDGRIVIYDGQGGRINQLSTNDEVKTAYGQYALEGKSFKDVDMTPDNRKVIILPEVRAHHDGASHIQWTNHMNMNTPGYKALRKIYGDYVETLQDEYLDLLNKMHTDPDIFREEIKHRYNLRDSFIDAISRSMEASDSKGVYHPDRLAVLTNSLQNTFIVNGILKGRNMTVGQRGKKVVLKRANSTVKIKPDLRRIVKKNEKAVIVGADNQALFDFAFQKYLESRIAKGDNNKQIESAQKLDKEAKVNLLNNWLETNSDKVKGLIGRNPIVGITGVIARKIKMFDIDAGNSVYLHPSDVTAELTGDADGDTVSMNLMPLDVINKLEKALNHPDIRNTKDIISDVNMIKTDDNLTKGVLDSNKFLDGMASLAKGINAQGLTIGYQAIRGTLSMKYGNISFNTGLVVKPIKPTDTITMDWVNFKEDYPASQLPSFARFEEKDGKRVLVTQAQHADQLLVNMAVDHPKKHMLSQTSFDGTKAWYMPYMFEVVEGELTEKEMPILLAMWKQENLGPFRNGKSNKDNSKLSMENWYTETLDAIKNTMLNEQDSMKVLNKIDKNTQVTKMEIVNTDDTIIKRMLKRPFQKIQKLKEIGGVRPKFPLHYTKEKQWNTHFKSLQELTPLVQSYQAMNPEAYKAGHVYSVKFAKDFYKLYNEGRVTTKEGQSDPTMQAFDYKEELHDFATSVEKDFAKQFKGKDREYINSFMAANTWNFLKGNIKSKTRNTLPDSKLLHPGIYKEYMRLHEKFFTEVNDAGTWVTSSQTMEVQKSGLYSELEVTNKTKDDSCITG